MWAFDAICRGVSLPFVSISFPVLFTCCKLLVAVSQEIGRKMEKQQTRRGVEMVEF